MTGFSYDPDGDESDWDPLQSGAAAPPPVQGSGCLARFDPQALNDESGVDYSEVVDQAKPGIGD